ncbi:WYL domain-containing protein [Agrobacterium vitis]|uniref:WYL domain-containing protein n=1 Tax=Agrobacterium vitis TaxID=373 RepID=UPI0008DBF72F|nr:WYL domain-containing protein [Agrobacterium vitis]MUO84020.1 hypothetical protein [Agrobacterium vitis]
MGEFNPFDIFRVEMEARPLPQPPRPVLLPDEDAIVLDQSETMGDAEGQSFMIEYVDSKGRASARRVTVWSIIAGSGGVPCLYAKCHERNAMRQFRIDRIRSCIDYDGEIFDDVPVFLHENFGMRVVASNIPQRDDAWIDVLDAVRADAVLLACIIRSDGSVHASEIEEAFQHILWVAENSGRMLDDLQHAALKRYLSRLRPTEKAISLAIDALHDNSPRRVERLLKACVSVMNADGKRDPRERLAINGIASQVLGVSIL